jgi:prepilin-type N-terminal cleavage/methylation domain-containing protein
VIRRQCLTLRRETGLPRGEREEPRVDADTPGTHGRSSQEASSGRGVRTSLGFTLPEVLIAATVFLLMSAAIVEMYLLSLRTWHNGGVQVSLQQKVAMAMQKMIQGQRAPAESRQHGLREAGEITLVAPHMIEFTSGVDSIKRQFYLMGNEILYRADGGNVQTIYDPSRSESGVVTDSYRTDLEFARLGDGTIEIEIVGKEKTRSGWISAPLRTRIAPRNSKKLEGAN